MGVKEKVLKKIFNDPAKRYYIRELATEAKVSPNSVINIVKELEKEEVIKKEIKRHVVEVSANLDNPRFIAKKRVFNLSQIYESGIIDILIKNYNPKAIILFGSYSRGEDIIKGDIDIAIVTDNKKAITLDSFEKKLNREIHLIFVQYKNISEELYLNLINGIVIYGYLDKK